MIEMPGPADKDILEKIDSFKGDMGTLRTFLINVIYEEMKSLSRAVESLMK